MIYSRWRPAYGGYDYFEAKEYDIPLGNDLPVPSLPRGTDIGVASIDAGRSIPSGARHVGTGDLAKGLVAPAAQSSALQGVFTSVPTSYWYAAVGVFLGWLVGTKRVKLS